MRRSIVLGLLVTMTSVCVMAPAPAQDCNGNRVKDDDDLQAGSSADCNSNGIPDECEQDLLLLSPNGALVELDAGASFLVSGDFDLDGDLDIVAGIAEPSPALVVSVNWSGEEGRGIGDFSAPTVIPLNSPVLGLAAADVDGDGRSDVAALTATSVFVFFNASGDDLFTAKSITLGAPSDGLALADVDGDGDLDVVTSRSDTRRSPGVSVALNVGERSFRSTGSLPAGGVPRALAAADIDGDGDVDIVTADAEPIGVTVYLNESCTESEGCTFSPFPVSLSGDRKPTLIRTGRLDANDSVDVVVAHGAAVFVLLNQGDGHSFETTTFAVSSSIVELTDLDGDGDLDIAASFKGRDRIPVLANDGDGHFQARTDVESRSPIVALLPGDFDGDHRMDLVVASPRGILSFLWGGREESVVFDPVRILISEWPHTAVVHDLDGDGDLDLFTGNGGHRSISVLTNDGGQLAVKSERDVGHMTHSLGWGDFDRDGDLDTVAATHIDAVLRVYSNAGDATFSQTQVIRNVLSPFFLISADINNDDWTDILVASESTRTLQIVFNDGAGNFALAARIRLRSGPRGIAPGDFDGDGDLDLAVAITDARSVAILQNQGDGSFGEPVMIDAGGDPAAIIARDLNDDGRPDLVTGTHSDRSLGVFYNREAGGFEPVRVTPFGGEVFSMQAADMNGDGLLDIVTSNADDKDISVLLAERDGGFRLLGSYSTGGTPRYAPLGDIDDDGDVDIVAVNRVAALVTVFYNLSNDSSTAMFLEQICTARDFAELAVASLGASPQADRLSIKYTMPARDDPALIPTVFQDTKQFALHQEFLGQVFREQFPALSAEVFVGLTQRRETRDYYIGAIERIRTAEGIAYLFSIVTAPGRDEVLTLEEVQSSYQRMSEAVVLRPLLYAPDPAGENPLARAAAEEWNDPGFPIFLDTVVDPNVDFTPYTTGVGYGRVRLLEREAFDEANESGRFTFQDIVVIDHSPRDIEGVVGGVVTAAPQGTFSHVSVRTARRGTPNAFVDKAMALFQPFEGQLVRFEVTEDEYKIDPATQKEAELFWDMRDGLPEPRPFDAEYRALDLFEEMEFGGDVPPVARFGGKASGLSRLQTILTGPYEEYRERGFAIPMAYYLDFMNDNAIPSEVDGRDLSYQEYLDELFDLEQFRTDSEFRFKALDDFRDFARKNGVIPGGLVDAIAARIEEVFGARNVMARHRSSSNVEDILDFNGAGLYESTSVCVDDTFDEDDVGPSLCDPDRNPERTIDRALRKVWTSLWTFRAFEERAFFKIPQTSVTMGILVNRSFLDEIVNGVAFTGDPANPRGGCYVVTAQVGEESVVSPEPGVLPEINILEVAGGNVVNIVRSQSSTLVEGGQPVLTDDKLNELGALMWHIDENYPIDTEGHSRESVLLDMEFKIEPDNSLAVKQIRPFLIPGDPPEHPTFELEIPPGAETCGVMSIISPSGSPSSEYEAKSAVRFRAGTVALPTSRCVFTAELFDEVVVGSAQQIASPSGPGVFRVTELPDANRTRYIFSFRQNFTLPGDRPFELSVFNLEFVAQGGNPLETTLVFDDDFITFDLSMRGFAEEPSLAITYSSCEYELLPRWGVDAVLEGGTTLRLEERFLPATRTLLTGPASLYDATVVIAAQEQSVKRYWDLVYAAGRHNAGVKYWVVLDPPVSVAGVDGMVHIVELAAPDPPELFQQIENPQQAGAAYLGENFEILARPEVVSFEKRALRDASFVRGDANVDGAINISDAIRILDTVFRGGEPFPCGKAADANDDGRFSISDAVWTLLHAFQGRTLAAPSRECGADGTADGLSCEAFERCP